MEKKDGLLGEFGEMPAEKPVYGMEDLREIVAALRGEGGCDWDREQTHATLTKYMKSEATEAVRAVEAEDDENLCEELGDVLLQVVLNAQLATERGCFTLDDVLRGICRKMIRRHPHVFGSRRRHLSTEENETLWQEIKREEFLDKQRGSAYK